MCTAACWLEGPLIIWPLRCQNTAVGNKSLRCLTLKILAQAQRKSRQTRPSPKPVTIHPLSSIPKTSRLMMHLASRWTHNSPKSVHPAHQYQRGVLVKNGRGLAKDTGLKTHATPFLDWHRFSQMGNVVKRSASISTTLKQNSPSAGGHMQPLRTEVNNRSRTRIGAPNCPYINHPTQPNVSPFQGKQLYRNFYRQPYQGLGKQQARVGYSLASLESSLQTSRHDWKIIK